MSGLLLAGAGAPPLAVRTLPVTREGLIRLLGVQLHHAPLRRHRTGLTITANGVEHDLYLIARADAEPEVERIKLFEIVAPVPALLVAQKAGATDFSEWIGYQEPTGFVSTKTDMRALLERALECEQAAAGEDARYLLHQLEGTLRDLGNLAPAGAGVVRLVALDEAGGVAAAANFDPADWLGMRNFSLRGFDARQTVLCEGVLRQHVQAGSSAESPPTLEYVRWSEKASLGHVVTVKIDGRPAFYGTLLPKPLSFDVTKTPARVPVAGLPVFKAGGQESKPVLWVRAG